MTNATETISKLQETIEKVINDYWIEQSSPMLLSYLGGINNGEISTQLKSIDVGLREFIERFLNEKVLLKSDDKSPIRIFAFPSKYVKKSDSLQQIIEDVKASSNSQPIPRYEFSVWAAFSKHIETGLNPVSYTHLTLPTIYSV